MRYLLRVTRHQLPIGWHRCYACGRRAELYVNGHALAQRLRRHLPACYDCAAYALPHMTRVQR